MLSPLREIMKFRPRVSETKRVSAKRVAFYHSHLRKAPLLRLYAFDSDGVDYDVAIAACSIVASNARGYFTTADGSPIERPETSLLSADEYLFNLYPGQHDGAPAPGEEGPLLPFPCLS